jgi:hypothetical protein
MSLSSEPTPEPTLSSKAPFRDADRAPTSESDATLPIPMGPLRSQLTAPRNESPRPSLWRRFTMRKPASESESSPNAEATAARLGAIELHLEQLNTSLDERLEALNERLSEVWESEEQLSYLADIQEKLDQLKDDQARLSRSVADLRRILGWTAGLVVVAAAALGFGLNQLS